MNNFDDEESQSPLIGAFVPGTKESIMKTQHQVSQSPLIGAFVPGQAENVKMLAVATGSLNPL